MLVLKRRIGEEIIINENIRIVVSQTTNNSCSLAIEAPAILFEFAELSFHRFRNPLFNEPHWRGRCRNES
jgi:hypothetical protein